MSFESQTFAPIDNPEPEQDLIEDGLNPEDVEATKEKIKKYENEIHVMLEALSLSQENKEEYISDQYESLLSDAEKSLETGKDPIVSDINVLGKSVELLRGRLHAVVDAHRNRQTEKDGQDPTLLRGVGLAMLLNHDNYGLKITPREITEDSNLEDFVRLISLNGERRKLTEKELNLLVSAGYGDILVKGLIKCFHNIDPLVEALPDSLFLLYINNKDSSPYVVESALKQKKEKGEMCPQACFQAILESPFSRYALKYFDSFEGGNIFDAIRFYSPSYPFQADDQIEIVKKLGLNTQEVLDVIVKNNSITRDDQRSMKDIDFFQATFDEMDSIKYLDYQNPDQDDLEAGLPMARKMITDGNVGFLHEKYTYVTWLVQNDYDWFMGELAKNKQEHMFVREMRIETQVQYLKKLIVDKNTLILRAILGDGSRVGWKEKAFSDGGVQRALTELGTKNFSPEEISRWVDTLLDLKSFCNELELSSSEAESYLVRVTRESSSENAIQLSNKIKTLLGEVSTYDQYTRDVYIKEFIDRDSTEAERKVFFERVNTGIDSLVQNQTISESGEMYGVVIRQVYPKRNFNTYVHDVYSDRSADIAQYSFERGGYATVLDGVSEYRVKRGETVDSEILGKYSARLQELGRIGNEANLDSYLTVCLGEESEKFQTTEGKLLRYCEGKSDAEVADILLAYQLRDEYNALVVGTRDRITDTTSQTEKEYIMLVELAERYGDRLKETIKEVMGRVASGPDRDQFLANSEELVGEGDISSLAEKISSDLGRIPEDKLTDALVQKKIATSLKTRFQRTPAIKDAVNSIVEKFTVADISHIDQKLLEQISLALQGQPIMGIDSRRIESIQNKTYQEIQTELEKYDEVMEEDMLKSNLGTQKKSIARRPIHGYFGKNRENAHARMVADVCLATDANMLENPNYFEFVLFDEDRKKNIGTTMLLVMQDGNKKYLLYCPNPSVDIVSKVSSQKLYDWNTKQVTEFARQNGFDGVLTDKRHGHSTNRPGKFYEALTSSLVKNPDGSEKTVSLADSHRLAGGYTYQNNLSVIWEK